MQVILLYFYIFLTTTCAQGPKKPKLSWLLFHLFFPIGILTLTSRMRVCPADPGTPWCHFKKSLRWWIENHLSAVIPWFHNIWFMWYYITYHIHWYVYGPGSSKCVKFVPVHQKKQPKGKQFNYISGRSRYILWCFFYINWWHPDVNNQDVQIPRWRRDKPKNSSKHTFPSSEVSTCIKWSKIDNFKKIETESNKEI